MFRYVYIHPYVYTSCLMLLIEVVIIRCRLLRVGVCTRVLLLVGWLLRLLWYYIYLYVWMIFVEYARFILIYYIFFSLLCLVAIKESFVLAVCCCCLTFVGLHCANAFSMGFCVCARECEWRQFTMTNLYNLFFFIANGTTINKTFMYCKLTRCKIRFRWRLFRWIKTRFLYTRRIDFFWFYKCVVRTNEFLNGQQPKKEEKQSNQKCVFHLRVKRKNYSVCGEIYDDRRWLVDCWFAARIFVLCNICLLLS